MMQIVFVACLLSQPASCLEDRLELWETRSPLACISVAQPLLARWRDGHPGYGIVRWACRNPDAVEYPA